MDLEINILLENVACYELSFLYDNMDIIHYPELCFEPQPFGHCFHVPYRLLIFLYKFYLMYFEGKIFVKLFLPYRLLYLFRLYPSSCIFL